MADQSPHWTKLGHAGHGDETGWAPRLPGPLRSALPGASSYRGLVKQQGAPEKPIEMIKHTCISSALRPLFLFGLVTKGCII